MKSLYSVFQNYGDKAKRRLIHQALKKCNPTLLNVLQATSAACLTVSWNIIVRWKVLENIEG